MPKISTNCIAVCDIWNGYCVGCKRSESEISKWLYITEKERKAIIEDCKIR